MRRDGYVVDVSVVVKWLVEEADSPAAARLLEPGVELAAPDLLFAEAVNTLWSMRRRGDFGDDAYAEAVAALVEAPLSAPYPMRDLAVSAARMASDLRHPVYDCFYLALAERLQYPVVTADQRFHDVVRGHPFLGRLILHLRDIG